MMRPDHRRPGGKVVEVDVERVRATFDRWHIRTARDVGSCFRA